MQRKETTVDLQEVYRNVLKNATDAEKLIFLTGFIERTDTIEDVLHPRDAERIHIFEKNSGFRFDAKLVKHATLLLSKRLKERVAKLRDYD